MRPGPPADPLVVLQLADDLDVLALLAQHGAHRLDVGRLADEGGEHHVHALVQAELEVLDVLLRHGGQVHGGARQVHALLAAQQAAVLDLAQQEVAALWSQGFMRY